MARLEKAFLLVTGAEDIARKMRAAHVRDWKEAVKKGVITQGEGDQIAAAHEAAAKVIEVDDFAPEELTGRGAKGTGAKGEASSQATSPAPPVAAE